MTYDLVVRGGTVVTASDSVRADIGVRGGRVAADRGGPRAGGLGDRGRRAPRAARRRRRAHPSRRGGGRRAHGRRLRDGHGGGGVRRHHDHLRLRLAVEGPVAAAGHRAVEGQGRGPRPRRLRVPRGRLRRGGRDARRDAAARGGGISEREGVHDQRVRHRRRGAPAPVRRGAGCGGHRQRARGERGHARPLRAGDARGGAPRPAALRGEPARARRGGGHAAGHRLRRARRRRGVHRAPVVRGGARGGERGAPARAPGVGGDAADLPRPHRRALRGGRDGGGQGDRRAPAPLRPRSGRAVGRAALGRHPGHRQRQHVVDGGAEGGGRSRLHAGAVRRARSRDGDARHLLGGRGQGAHRAPDVRGGVLDQSRPHLRPVSAEGHDRGGQRRRLRPLRPRARERGRRAPAPLARRDTTPSTGSACRGGP